MSKGNIICYGEVLWDSVPRGLLPGGAPTNLAYHLAQLGWATWPLSAVGDDVLGEEILLRLRRNGVRTDLIAVRDDLATGLVRVTLGDGIPTYEILRGVAWDAIEIPATLPAACLPVAAIVFGSLAQRTAHNRAQLDRLLEGHAHAFKVFDANLRPPHVDIDRVWELAARSDLIKLNDEETELLLGESLCPDDFRSAATAVSVRSGASFVCITAGAAGAGLWHDGDWTWSESQPVTIRDTIGAGDAFLSRLAHGILSGETPYAVILERANRLAGFVASSEGATPGYRIADSGEIIPL